MKSYHLVGHWFYIKGGGIPGVFVVSTYLFLAVTYELMFWLKNLRTRGIQFANTRCWLIYSNWKTTHTRLLVKSSIIVRLIGMWMSTLCGDENSYKLFSLYKQQMYYNWINLKPCLSLPMAHLRWSFTMKNWATMSRQDQLAILGWLTW